MKAAVRLRLFIALPCPLTPPIAAAVDELRASQLMTDSGLRIVAPDTLHITLAFLGSTPAERVADVHAAMLQLRDIPAPSLAITGAGAFPSALWLGVKDTRVAKSGLTTLTVLAQRCETALRAQGFELERRPFHPHVTLARLRNDAQFDCAAWCAAQRDKTWAAFTADTVHLYRSETLDGGARYSVIHSIALG